MALGRRHWLSACFSKFTWSVPWQLIKRTGKQNNRTSRSNRAAYQPTSVFRTIRSTVWRHLKVFSSTYAYSGDLSKTDYARRVATWFTAGALLFGVLVAASVLSGGFFPVIAGLSGTASMLLCSGTAGVGLMGLFATVDALRGGPDCQDKNDDGYQQTAFSAGKRWGYFGRLLFASLCLSLVIAVAAVATPALPGAAPVFAGLFAGAKFGVWAHMGILAAGTFAAMSTMHALGAASMALPTRFSQRYNPQLRAACRWFAKAFSLFAFGIAGISVISSIAPATLAAFNIAAAAKSAVLAMLQTVGIASGIYIAFNAAVSLCAAGVAYWANKPGFVAHGLMTKVQPANNMRTKERINGNNHASLPNGSGKTNNVNHIEAPPEQQPVLM